MEAGLVCEFHYVTQFEIWLKASLPQFCCCKFHKHSVVCGKDPDCWQAPILEMTILKVKENEATECKLIFFIY